MNTVQVRHVGTLYGLPVYVSPSISLDGIWLCRAEKQGERFYGLFATDLETIERLEGGRFIPLVNSHLTHTYNGSIIGT